MPAGNIPQPHYTALVNIVAFRNSPYFHRVAFTLQDRATLREFNCLINRISFHNYETANGLLYFTKWPVRNRLVRFHHPGILKI